MRRSASEVSVRATGALRAGSTFTFPPAPTAAGLGTDGEPLFANWDGGGGISIAVFVGEEEEVGGFVMGEGPSNLAEAEDEVAVRFVNRVSAAVRHDISV